MGFSEHHPVDKIGRDGVRSQENRRVEILFFDTGEEPDLVLAESDPDISEIYLPAEYVHVTLPPAVTAKRKGVALQLETTDGLRVPGIDFIAVMEGGSERTGTLDANGSATINAIPGAKFQVDTKITTRSELMRWRRAWRRRWTPRTTRLWRGLSRARAGCSIRSRARWIRFFPRGDLIEEIRSVTRGTESEDSANYFLAGLGFGEETDDELVAFEEPTKGDSAVV